MRLFTAIELPDTARQAIASTQQRLRAAMPGGDVKWVRPEHMHLTLVFLGAVDNDRVPALVEAMSASFDLSAFSIEFGGAGVFPPRGAPRVLWLGISPAGPSSSSGLHQGGERELIALQRSVAARTAPFCAPDDRPFHPHVTLARWRGGGARFRREWLDVSTGFVARAVVDSVTLFESRPSSAGPSYTALARASLTCR